ncbi:synapse-associated protein of 47 kDa isoform X2 [Stomoxys calcitrans]|uniref:synapse-associated protein of 47 kDa isoform X2 n=1 Tax=Stomoxys calcitrans TaxID=35570 RepID=UPI0027E393CB|nr:synapse-associated protein of 47 kDa isoform X2 [Stomoxys calcitrans]
MFSNITNQFTSLVGAVKGGNEEDVPADGAPAAAPAAAAEHQDPAAATAEGAEGEEGAKSSPSLVDTFIKETSGWLGSAKGWLGSASIPSMPAMPSMPTMAMPSMPAMPSIPSIPGLRKGGEEGADGAAVPGAENPAAGSVAGAEDEDKSRYLSATEGADSLAASGDEAQLGEEGQIGQVTTKVTQQAKHFGSFLSSAFTEAGSKIKETVKKNPIMESFNKEQEAFIKGQAGGNGQAVAPWVGLTNEAKIKEEIMGLSQDRRNFVRAPPAGIDFEFNYDTAYPTANAIMEEDKNLETMRFELVPKIITEENFWRNYFYRVSLIIQAAELGTLGEDGVAQASSGEDVKVSQTKETSASNDKSLVKSDQTSSSKNDASSSSSKSETTGNLCITQEPQKAVRLASTSESEFVSDAFQTTTDSDLEEIKDGMRKLGIDSMTQQLQTSTNVLSNDEEQWEKDLEAELKDYEVVDNANKKSHATNSQNAGGNEEGDDDELPSISNMRMRTSNNDWEEYADLIEDTDDLKTLKSLKRVMLGYQ